MGGVVDYLRDANSYLNKLRIILITRWLLKPVNKRFHPHEKPVLWNMRLCFARYKSLANGK